ncbi:thioredoxin-like protein [Suillus subalutaceus]|uniref:thioredoxin-like protein n=1 Tax=Suillus subalutaceus TaxID=48586 RepID=UPI001B87398A|nr:thioredoxin-like protein [Suillus subalutaceus]KAG1854486.1 thioredoxin-like protein [Suillus subalutaceus]
MDADIEHLVLSGKLFGNELTPSPTLSFASASSDSSPQQPDVAQQESIGMGPGRTGVKGVIRDQHEAATLQAERRAREMEEVRRRMERANLEGEKRIDVLGLPRAGRFGHLREVGRGGFVSAVEREDRGVWVVVHLYDRWIGVMLLMNVLARLARTYPETKFVRARAAALGFASTAVPSLSSRARSGMPGRFIDDDEDPYTDEAGEMHFYDDDDDEGEQEEAVDTDMLPTLLVYRDGELVHNWVRVDWEAGQAGVEDLLARRNVISSFRSTGNCGLPEDDGDDLIWSDEDDKER